MLNIAQVQTWRKGWLRARETALQLYIIANCKQKLWAPWRGKKGSNWGETTVNYLPIRAKLRRAFWSSVWREQTRPVQGQSPRVTSHNIFYNFITYDLPGKCYSVIISIILHPCVVGGNLNNRDRLGAFDRGYIHINFIFFNDNNNPRHRINTTCKSNRKYNNRKKILR